MKVLKKILKIVLIIVLVLLVLWGVANLAKFIIYPDYMQQRQNVCPIPDLNNGFIPQGITYDAESGSYIMSGYTGDRVALYVVSSSDYKEVRLLNEDGQIFEGHGGGVTVAGKYVYVADGGCLTAFNIADIRENDTATAVKKIKVDNSASYVSSDGNYVYVGEFYRAGNYETEESHYFTTPEGEENKAIVSAYKVEEDGEINAATPEFSVSLPSLVQGFAMKDGGVILSRSWGLSSSKIEFYGEPENSGKTISASGKEVPLYYVGRKTLIKSVDAPFFSEDITVVGDRVVINFESATNKYIIGKLFFATHATSYPIPSLNK